MSKEHRLWYIAQAKAQYQSDGEIEVDDNAMVSMGAEDGAYVQAWVWVDDAPPHEEEPEYAGYEYMFHPCIHCGTPLADTFPYALCTPCQETASCVHGNRYKDGCSQCDAGSDRAYDAQRERR